MQEYLLLGKVDSRAYILPNVSNIFVFGTDSLEQVFEKCNISNNFEQELKRSCNLAIMKKRSKGATARTNFCLSLDNV